MKHLELAVLTLLLAAPTATTGAQERQADRDAFTWSGRIPDGRSGRAPGVVLLKPRTRAAGIIQPAGALFRLAIRPQAPNRMQV